MFPYKELLDSNNVYQPLGSVKAAFNKEYYYTFTKVDIKLLFLSESNIKMVAHKIYKKYRQDGGRSDYYKILDFTRNITSRFLNKYNIYDFEYVDNNSTDNINWVELLKTVNNIFIKYALLFFKNNYFVPTREWAEIGSYNTREHKKFSELTAEDIPTIDLWQNQEIQILNRIYRNNNEIPFWQTTMHNRHYDRSNDGLQYGNSDRSSLDNFIHHSYDMSSLLD